MFVIQHRSQHQHQFQIVLAYHSECQPMTINHVFIGHGTCKWVWLSGGRHYFVHIQKPQHKNTIYTATLDKSITENIFLTFYRKLEIQTFIRK